MENNYEFYNTLNRYFKRLSQVGYIPDNDMYSVLILYYINNIKDDKNITDKDKYIIDRAISCLQGTCLIPYNTCNKSCIR